MKVPKTGRSRVFENILARLDLPAGEHPTCTGRKPEEISMRLNVENMTCGHCRASVEKAIASVDPAASVTVDLPGRTVDIESQADAETLMGAIRAEGYEVRAA
tara:strand:- start:3476 stop:3784 length:309 start_codon:yes stop_codon:yes gene_type:complete